MTDDELETYLFDFARNQQARPFGTYERCAQCQHDFHGLPCQQQLPMPAGGGTAPCMCPGGQP